MPEYKILSSTNPDELTEEINRLLKKGWRPIGGIAVAVAVIAGKNVLYQAMLHEAKKKPNSK